MPTILYGLSGEGSGHVSRARALVPFLERAGYTVHVVGYGRATEQLKSKVKNYTDIFGWHIRYRAGRTDLLRTFSDNLFASPKALRSMIKIDRVIQKIKPTLVISDFEPFVAYGSYRHSIPLISVDNQHALTNAAVSTVVRNRLAHIAAESVTEIVVPRARHFFITSFVPLKVTHKKTTIIPPLVDPEVTTHPVRAGSRILVYINNMSTQKLILPILRTIPESFMVYGAHAKSKGNTIVRSFSRSGFLRDLSNAKAVISTAGFSLISEALWMQKPMLVLPLQDQFEQLVNASYIQLARYGNACYVTPTRDDIELFLQQLPEFKEYLAQYPYRNIDEPLETILKKVKEFC